MSSGNHRWIRFFVVFFAFMIMLSYTVVVQAEAPLLETTTEEGVAASSDVISATIVLEKVELPTVIPTEPIAIPTVEAIETVEVVEAATPEVVEPVITATPEPVEPVATPEPLPTATATAIPLPDPLPAPSNIACLPFPQPVITGYNGRAVNGPYTSASNQVVITWKDNSEGETGYLIERQVDGEAWEQIAHLRPNSTIYTNIGLNPDVAVYYRVRAVEGEVAGYLSAACSKPLFVDSEAGNFRIFYRLHGCPAIRDDEGKPYQVCVSDHNTAQQIAATLEAARLAFIELGFRDPVYASPMPVDLFPNGDVGYAYISSGGAILFDPYYMSTYEGRLWVPIHELFHQAQRAYGGLNDPNFEWVTEGQARMVQDKLCLAQDEELNCNRTLDEMGNSNYQSEVNRFLANPNQSLTEASYQAALFWTYLSEQYGSLEQEPEQGVDLLVTFWQLSATYWGSDGINLINQTLASVGSTDRFPDVVQDFTVANYAKQLSNAPEQYQYQDEQQANGAYRRVPLTLDAGLTDKQQITLESDVVSWGARYFRVWPDTSVEVITVTVDTLTEQPLSYTLLSIKDGSINEETRETTASFRAEQANNELDQVVLVVTGLQQESQFELSIAAIEEESEPEPPIATSEEENKLEPPIATNEDASWPEVEHLIIEIIRVTKGLYVAK